jgi:protein-S-isoprenylcysteine O-methyltransferase Ste14
MSALGKTAQRVTAARHVRAIVLLPVVNTIVLPAVVLALTRGKSALELSVSSAAEIGFLLAGGVCAALGVGLAVHAIHQFVVRGEGTLAPWDPAHRLLTGGAYRFTRNPLKIGLFLALLGEAIVLRSLPLFTWFAFFAVANIVYIRVAEEPGLRRRFGSEYDEYAERVPRWLPALRAAPARLRRVRGGA